MPLSGGPAFTVSQSSDAACWTVSIQPGIPPHSKRRCADSQLKNDLTHAEALQVRVQEAITQCRARNRCTLVRAGAGQLQGLPPLAYSLDLALPAPYAREVCINDHRNNSQPESNRARAA